MPQIPDLSNPRYRDEIGWFLYHENMVGRNLATPMTRNVVTYSRLLLKEVLRFAEHDTNG